MRRIMYIVALSAGATLLSCSSGPDVAGIDALVTPATPSRGVIVSPSDVTLAPGQSQQFSAQLIQDGKQKKAAFTWSSSDPSVATVSSAGLVTAVAFGDATITATASPTQSGTAHVSVPAPPPTIVAHIPLGGNPFGSTVSSNGTAWVGQLQATTAQRLDIPNAQFTGNAPTGASGTLPVQLYPDAAGSKVYVASFGGMVASISTTTLTIVNTVRFTGDGYGVTATPAGDTVFVGITDGPIYKIDLANGLILNTLTGLPTAAGYHFAWNQSHSLLYASARGFDGGRVFEIDPVSLQVVRTFATGGSPQGIQQSSDGSKLFIAAEAGNVIVWDIASNTQAGTITTGCQGYGLVRTPDNSRLFVSCALNGLVVVVNPTTGAMITTLNVGGSPRELSFDPGTGSVIVPNEGGWVDIVR
jgi:YVTN family beta-propeller protein